MTITLNEIRASFLVRKAEWPELDDWLVAHAKDDLTRRLLTEASNTICDSKKEVFLDRIRLREVFLGQIVLEPMEFLRGLHVAPRVFGVSWNVEDFLIEFSLNEPFLNGCSEEQRQIVKAAFSACLEALLKERLDSPPMRLSSTEFHLDVDLDSVRDAPDIAAYLDHNFRDGAKASDVFWSTSGEPVLFVWTPQTLQEPAHVLVSSRAETLASISAPVARLRWHEALRSVMDGEIRRAKCEAERALALREKLSPLAATRRSLYATVRGLYALSVDPWQDIGSTIIDLNAALQALRETREVLAQIRTVYEEPLLWPADRLTLVRAGAARGRLIDVSQAEVAHLTLSAYLRRSGLQIIEFYDRAIEETCGRLREVLESFNVLLSVQSTRQTDLLNRLVLILALASVFVGVLQVLSAFKYWQTDYRLLLLAGVLVLLLLAPRLWAGLHSRRSRGR